MKYEITFRIIILEPPAGAVMRVQRGNSELLDPAASDADRLIFDFSLSVDLSANAPNFLGKYAQGPKDARFVYVNSGRHAGQHGTHWDRRAKLSLMSITREDVEAVLASDGARFETTINGTGRDGGPVCASVKGLEWKIARK